jgi:MFS family permease
MTHDAAAPGVGSLDSSTSWLRLAASVLLATIGGAGMWSFAVALPAVQAEFGAGRAEASLPFSMIFVGFAVGGVVMGRWSDRAGIVAPVICGVLLLAASFVASGYAPSLWAFALLQGMIGLGSSTTLGPLMADISHWFARRRGIAVALCSAGNMLSGAVWPPIVQHFIADHGWRPVQIGLGLFCVATMLPLALALRRRAPLQPTGTIRAAAMAPGTLGLSSTSLTILLSIAGVACCVAMAMPQVHIVAYCGDLGYGPARGAEMLALMMGCGVVSRIITGVIADRIGGLPTLLLGSALQAGSLLLYIFFDGLASLFLISALFGLVQGGIIPSYAIVVREYFAPSEAGMRVGVVLMATLFGMAAGGWMSGAIFDLAGSYRAAFLNGLAWNLVNAVIVLWLLTRPGRRTQYASP